MRATVFVACALLAGAAVGLSVESDVAQLAEVSADSLESHDIAHTLDWATEKFHEMPPRHEVKRMLGEATTCLGEAKGIKFGRSVGNCLSALASISGAKRKPSKKKIRKLKKKLKKKKAKAKKKAKKKKKHRREALAFLEEDESEFSRLQHTVEWVRSRKAQIEQQLGEESTADKICLNENGKGAGAGKVMNNCMGALSAISGKSNKKATKKKAKKLKKKHKKKVKKAVKKVKKKVKKVVKATNVRRRRSSRRRSTRRRRWRI